MILAYCLVCTLTLFEIHLNSTIIRIFLNSIGNHLCSSILSIEFLHSLVLVENGVRIFVNTITLFFIDLLPKICILSLLSIIGWSFERH